MITSPLASLVILVLGAQFFQTYLSLALKTASYSEFQMGLVHSAHYAGILLSALYSEKLIHRIGHIRAFTTFTGIITATILAQAFQVNLALWVGARFVAGLALAALYVTIESWLLAESTALDRSKRLAIYMITLYSSQAVSSQLLKIVDVVSLQPFILAALLCALANIPVSLTYKATPILPQRATLNIPHIFSLSPYGFFGCLASGMILSALYSFMPNYADEYHLSVSLVMTILICGGFLLQWPFGKLSDILNREKVLIGLSIFCVIPALLLFALPFGPFTYMLVFLLGGLSFAVYPISISLTCDRIQNTCIVQATGVLLFSYGIGSVLGPMLSSRAIQSVQGYEGLFVYIAAVWGGYGIVGCYQSLRLFRAQRPEPILEHTVDCVLLPHQSPVANQLDPRQELQEEETPAAITLPDAANEDNLQVRDPVEEQQYSSTNVESEGEQPTTTKAANETGDDDDWMLR